MPYAGIKREDLQRKVQKDKDFKKKLDTRKAIRMKSEQQEGPTGSAAIYHDTSLEELFVNLKEYDVLPDSYMLSKYEVRALFELLELKFK